MDIFKGYNITEVNPVMEIGKYKSGSSGFLRMIDIGLKNQDITLPFQPFIIIEDDCSFYRQLPETIEIPDNSDIVYIGISRFGTNPRSVCNRKVYMKEVTPEIVRIYNMLSTHGLMVCSASGAAVITKTMMESYYLNKPYDLALTYIQPYYNVYALKTPLVYQDSHYGGLEYDTRFEYNSIINEDLPQEFYMTKCDSVITSYITIIPKRILQIVIGEEYMKSLPMDIIKHNIMIFNSEYEYILFTEADCINFISCNFPEHLELYNKITRAQYKSDLIRYLYIYMNGGYYVDIDILLLVGFDELNKLMDYPSAFFTLGADRYNFKYYQCANGFIGSKEKNPLFLELVQKMYLDINPGDYLKNTKIMHSSLKDMMITEPYKKTNGVFLLQEYSKNNDLHYFIKSGSGKDVAQSNGNGYPHNLFKWKWRNT